jgi:hypothetical protein
MRTSQHTYTHNIHSTRGDVSHTFKSHWNTSIRKASADNALHRTLHPNRAGFADPSLYAANDAGSLHEPPPPPSLPLLLAEPPRLRVETNARGSVHVRFDGLHKARPQILSAAPTATPTSTRDAYGDASTSPTDVSRHEAPSPAKSMPRPSVRSRAKRAAAVDEALRRLDLAPEYPEGSSFGSAERERGLARAPASHLTLSDPRPRVDFASVEPRDVKAVVRLSLELAAYTKARCHSLINRNKCMGCTG